MGRPTAHPLAAARLTAQLVSGSPAGDPVTATRHLLAVQAQDGRGARLAIRARTAGGGAADVDRALTEDRSLVISWLCRGTLHLVAREDVHWLHALTTPPLLTSCLRRLSQEGVSPADADRAVAEIERALADDGRLHRDQLSARVQAIGVRTEGQAFVHILFLATLRGLIVRGPLVGRHHAYALVRDWLEPAPRRFDRDAALAELARRYLRGHWPADERDLARWAGLPLRDARAGLSAIAGELASRADGLLMLRGAPEAAPLPPPRLLGPWDPAAVGWTDRAWLNGPHETAVVSGGLFRRFALVRGQVVAVWAVRSGVAELGPWLDTVSVRDRAALARDARAVEDYLDLGGSDRA